MRITLLVWMAVLLLASSFPNNSTGFDQPDKGSLKELPSFSLGGDRYRVDPYITAAAMLRAAGRDKAVEALREQPAESTFVLCRMLFTAKSKQKFRRPRIGAAVFLGETDYADWPLEPIEVVDGVPFLIVWGYRLGGRAELPARYLDYCLKECDWRTTEYKARTAAEKQKALEKLLASPKWKKPLSDWERSFLSGQIK